MYNAKITLETITTILASGIEVFPRETAGTLYGRRVNNHLDICIAFPHQTAERRRRDVSVPSDCAELVKLAITNIIDGVYIGDYHSHTFNQNATIQRCLSGEDIKSIKGLFCNNHMEISLLLTIKKLRDYYEAKMSINNGGSIIGYLENYNFVITGYSWDRKKSRQRRIHLYNPMIATRGQRRKYGLGHKGHTRARLNVTLKRN